MFKQGFIGNFLAIILKRYHNCLILSVRKTQSREQLCNLGSVFLLILPVQVLIYSDCGFVLRMFLQIAETLKTTKTSSSCTALVPARCQVDLLLVWFIYLTGAAFPLLSSVETGASQPWPALQGSGAQIRRVKRIVLIAWTASCTVRVRELLITQFTLNIAFYLLWVIYPVPLSACYRSRGLKMNRRTLLSNAFFFNKWDPASPSLHVRHLPAGVAVVYPDQQGSLKQDSQSIFSLTQINREYVVAPS